MEEEDLFDEFACDDLENLQINSSQNSQNSTAGENKKRPKKQPPRSTTLSYDSTGALKRRGTRTPRHGSAISSRSSVSSSSNISSVSGSGSINGSRSSSSGGIKQDKFSDVDESGDRSQAASNLSANSVGFSKFGSEAHSRVSAYQDSRIQPDVRYGQARLSRSDLTTEIYKKYYIQQRGAGGVATGKLIIPENVGRDDQGRPLPIMESSDLILQNFDRQQVTLISGETGSGKSTVVPQLIMDHMVKSNQGGCIWVTQPRRIAAITIAERVANSRKPNWRAVGQGLVGYHVGLDKNTCQDSRIIYMTPGIVSNKMQSDRELRSVRCLIIDEVHERDVETEMLLLLAKHLIRINKDIRVILMSATMTPEQFKKYLTVGDVEPAIVKAKGRPYEVTNFYMHDIQNMFPNRNSEPVVFYAQQDNTEISPAQRTLCIDILKGLDDLEFKRNAEEPGAVLIFLPGLYEINSMKRLIQNVARQYNLDFAVERLHSSLPRDRDSMNRIIAKQNNPPGRWRRKIVLSTNMGESSITISDCAYVIDFCLTKYTTKHDTAKLTRLVQNWASKEMCEQRSGRAGRTKDGMCFRIIDKKFWELHIPNTQKEEILRVPLNSCVLLGKSVFPHTKPIDFLKDALARPNDTEVLEAIRSLKEVGALTMTAGSRPETDNESDMAITSEDLEDGMLTPFGKLMNLLPIDQTCVRLIQLGYMVGMTYEAIIIAACSSVEAFWNYNKDVCEDEKDNAEYINAYKSRLYWASGTYSDHIAMMNAFLSWYQKMPETYRKNYTKREHKFPKLIRNPQYPSQLLTDQRKEIEWTQKMGLNAKALREVHMLCEDIIKRLISSGYHLGDEAELNESARKVEAKLLFMFTEDAYRRVDISILLGEVVETEATKDSNAFNGTTTVYFKGVSPHENYKVGSSILRRFRNCGPISRLYFDDTRIFVEFASEIDTPEIFPSKSSLNKFYEKKHYSEFGNVSPAVICAMKLSRRRGETSSFMRFHMNEDLRPVEQMGARFFWYDVLGMHQKLAIPKMNRHKKKYFATVSAFENLVEFYAVEQGFEDIRDKMEEGISRLQMANKLQPFSFPVEKLAMVLAPFGDSDNRTYHRAVVLAEDIDNGNGSPKVLVRYVDYGNRDLVDYNDLRVLDQNISYKGTNIADTEWLAVRYKLRGVQPVQNTPKRYEYALYDGTHCQIDIYSTVRGEYVLADVTVEGQNVGEKLVQEGYCQWKEENKADQNDQQKWIVAEARRKHSGDGDKQNGGQTRTSDSALPRSPNPTCPSDSNSSPEATEGKRWIEVRHDPEPENHQNSSRLEKKIQGPYNMYTTKIQPLFQTTCSSDVQANSINSVIINPHPESNEQTLICGQDVSLVSGENMQASFTTMLPNINGIIELCGLLFAPSYQIRHINDLPIREQRRRKNDGFSELTNVGALFGCGGYKQKTTKQNSKVEFISILPDHDVERPFTVEIDDADLEMIQEIREQFNQFLGGDHQFTVSQRSGTSVVSRQKEISRKIFELLYRPRQSVGKYDYTAEMKWKTSSDGEYFVPKFKKDTAFPVPRT